MTQRSLFSLFYDKSITYAIRTEESLQPIYKKLSLSSDYNRKSMSYAIRTEESLHPLIKNFRSYFDTTINQ
nr:hypothetical protein ABCDPFEC_00222 [Acinetobacter pittii]